MVGSDRAIETNRRDLLQVSVFAMAAVGLGAAVWPFVDQMNPAADGERGLIYDLRRVPISHQVMLGWRDAPILIRHRSAAELGLQLGTTSPPCSGPSPTPGERGKGTEMFRNQIRRLGEEVLPRLQAHGVNTSPHAEG
jgi:Rieske Fe-S protein